MNTDALYEYIKTLEARIEVLEGTGDGEAVSDKVNRSGDTMTGTLTMGAHVYLNNAKYIYGKNTDGNLRNLMGLNGSNQMVIGYGLYDASEGTTYLEGNTVSILSKNTATVNNALTASGLVTGSGFRVSGHANNIGYATSDSDEKSIASGTSAVALSGNIALTAGTWILTGRASFPSNATGRRYLAFYNVTSGNVVTETVVTSPAVNGTFTGLQTVYIVGLSEARNYRLNCYQNSGSALTVSYQWHIARIA